MTFGQSWVLWLTFLPVVWVVFAWRRSLAKPRLILKASSALALLLALSEPRLPVPETKMAVAVLADTSDSVSAADLEQASALVSEILEASGRHWVKVVPFAREPRAPEESETASQWRLRHTAGAAARATDLEQALREGMATLPARLVPKIVLISDGKENRGDATRAAWLASQMGIPVDTYALRGREQPRLLVESVRMPALVYTGERFPVEIVVHAPSACTARLEIAAEGKLLGASDLALEAGANRLRARASLATDGVVELSVSIAAEGLGQTRFAHAVSVRQPELLYLSKDPAGAGRHLVDTLKAARFSTVETSELPMEELDDYQVAVVNNWDLQSMPEEQKLALERFVTRGGGLAIIGGENNIHLYKEEKAPLDPLERTLPATIAPPRSPEGTAVVLIIDKSSSMEGRKMELARLAAIGVVENLRPVDMVGVLVFDNSFQWAVPVRRAEDRSAIKRVISGIIADGGTQIAPALAEAYRRTLPVKATYRHIVLLTDGISEEGDSLTVAKEAAAQRVTISTVGLGQDVNRAYLERVAAQARGKSYFLSDPSGVEQILLRDVREHTGSTVIEKPFVPSVRRKVEILDAVPWASAPELKGYVRYEAKPSAEVILAVDDKDPLLVRWQYGLGRAAVFTSDAKSRWAEDWVNWPGFDKFWTNLMRDLLPRVQTWEASIRFEAANSELVVEYRFPDRASQPSRVPDVYVLGADGFQRPMEIRKAAEGLYRGRTPVGDQRGLFRVRPLETNEAFPETGFYRPEEELSEWGSNPDLLRRLSEYTGGSFQPQPRDVFRSGGRAITTVLDLWPALLGLAILLGIAELVLRKWRGIALAFKRA